MTAFIDLTCTWPLLLHHSKKQMLSVLQRIKVENTACYNDSKATGIRELVNTGSLIFLYFSKDAPAIPSLVSGQ